VIPALAGSMATVLVFLGLGVVPSPTAEVATDQVSFHFELHAPDASRVELLGTFNDWQAGQIVLRGPDASGHWEASVDLPAGRHEYVFLVDGKEWIADPEVGLSRPDGFGRENTVITIYEDDNA
jgi:1,4-alpha-glucan branching enzyme